MAPAIRDLYTWRIVAKIVPFANRIRCATDARPRDRQRGRRSRRSLRKARTKLSEVQTSGRHRCCHSRRTSVGRMGNLMPQYSAIPICVWHGYRVRREGHHANAIPKKGGRDRTKQSLESENMRLLAALSAFVLQPILQKRYYLGESAYYSGPIPPNSLLVLAQML